MGVFEAVKHFNWRSSLRCLVTLWTIEDFWLIGNFASDIIFIATQWLKECRWTARPPPECYEPVRLVLFVDWEDQFLHKFSSTDIPVLGSFKWLFPESRRFPSPLHDSNPASRSPLTLNSRIPAFKYAQSRIPKNLLGILYIVKCECVWSEVLSISIIESSVKKHKSSKRLFKTERILVIILWQRIEEL